MGPGMVLYPIGFELCPTARDFQTTNRTTDRPTNQLIARRPNQQYDLRFESHSCPTKTTGQPTKRPTNQATNKPTNRPTNQPPNQPMPTNFSTPSPLLSNLRHRPFMNLLIYIYIDI